MPSAPAQIPGCFLMRNFFLFFIRFFVFYSFFCFFSDAFGTSTDTGLLLMLNGLKASIWPSQASLKKVS
jgi:hypothetical protein